MAGSRRPPLSAAEERSLIQRARDADARAEALLRTVPEAARLLDERRPSASPTHVYHEPRQRVARAVARLAELAAEDPELRPTLRDVQAAQREAEALRWELVTHFPNIVSGEATKLPWDHLSREDLEQEGYFGLLRAAWAFDPGRGLRFNTYARWWARAAMTRAIEAAGRNVRLTGAAIETTRLLRRELDAQPPGERSIAAAARRVGVSVDRAHTLLAQRDAYWLREGDDPDGTRPAERRETVTVLAAAAPEAAPLEDRLDRHADVQRMRDALRRLDPRTLEILAAHHGLDGREPETLTQTGQRLGLTRQRVQQIEANAYARLRQALQPYRSAP